MKRTLISSMLVLTLAVSMVVGCGTNETKVKEVEVTETAKKEVTFDVAKGAKVTVGEPVKLSDLLHEVVTDTAQDVTKMTLTYGNATLTVEDGKEWKADAKETKDVKDVTFTVGGKAFSAKHVPDVKLTFNKATTAEANLKVDVSLVDADKQTSKASTTIKVSVQSKADTKETERTESTEKEDAKASDDANKGTDEKTTDTASTSSGNTSSGNTSSGNTSSGNTSSNSGNTSSNSGNTATEQPKVTHTHSWTPHTATRDVWVTNMVDVPVYESQAAHRFDSICSPCGAVFGSVEECTDHQFANDHPGRVNVACTHITQVLTGYRQEDHGHNVTESYTDYHYCSCGATQ